jgi:hypothetical protein
MVRTRRQEHLDRMDDNRLAQSQKMGNQTPHLDVLQNAGAKVAHQHRRRTSTLDKIQDMLLQEEEEEKIFLKCIDASVRRSF